jgi:hypothetical protein
MFDVPPREAIEQGRHRPVPFVLRDWLRPATLVTADAAQPAGGRGQVAFVLAQG